MASFTAESKGNNGMSNFEEGEGNNGWQLAKKKQGVQVFLKSMPGTKLKASKGIVRIKSSVDEALALLQDFDNLKNWLFSCSESKLIKQVSETEHYVYTVIDAPWPVSDRDLPAKSIASRTPEGGILIKLEAAPDSYPKRKGMVRVKKMQGHWKITPVGSDEIEVEYYLFNDPGGNIPDWAVNTSATDIPLRTLVTMKEKLEQQ